MNRRKKLIVRSAVDTASILGTAPKTLTERVKALGNICVICLKKIPAERINALKMLNVPLTRWTHTTCSQTTKIHGIYLGEAGTSQLQLCDKVYNDSVRQVFRKSEVNEEEENDGEEEKNE